MAPQSLELPVIGTASRPSFLPLFVLGSNNLNPGLRVEEEGLEVRVVKTTRLDWKGITRVEVKKGLNSTYAVITHNRWDYIAHFSDLSGLRTLVNELRSRGVTLSDSAKELASSTD